MWGGWHIVPLTLDLALDWDEWSVSCTGHFISWERVTSTCWVRGYVGPRVGVGMLEKKEILPLLAVSPWSMKPITWLQWLSYPHSCTKSELIKLAHKLSMPGPDSCLYMHYALSTADWSQSQKTAVTFLFGHCVELINVAKICLLALPCVMTSTT